MSSVTQQPFMPSQSQQPVVIYPSTEPPPSGSSSQSNGSFGTVFIVLAVIIVISVIVCCLERLCKKKKKIKTKPKQNHKVSSKEREFAFHPKERGLEFGFENGIPMGRPVPHSHGNLKGFKPSEFHPKERDLELGFENGIPMGRPVPPSHGDLKGFKPSENGHLRSERLRPMDREPKAGPMKS